MNIVLLGPPGSGKGTQAILIAQKLNLAHISTGDILREAIATKTKYGQMAEEQVKSGKLVSDEIVGNIVKEKLATIKGKNGFLFDGYPRTINQAGNLDDALKSISQKLDFVVYLDVASDAVTKRILGRRMCKTCGRNYNIYFDPPKDDEKCDDDGTLLYRREDDNEDTIKERLNVYFSQTSPLLDLYKSRNILVSIAGTGEVSEINDTIVSAITGK